MVVPEGADNVAPTAGVPMTTLTLLRLCRVVTMKFTLLEPAEAVTVDWA